MQHWRGSTSNEEFIAHVERFLAHLGAKRYSVQSVEKRRQDLRRFFLYLDDRNINRLQDVASEDLQGFHACLIDRGYKDTVIESGLRAVKLLFDFLQDDGTIFENPARRMKIPKSPVRIGTVLTEKEMKRLLAAPDLSTNVGIRDRAMMEVLYSTGIRRGELVGLAVHDVDLDRTTLRVRGKGNKVRLLPLGREAVKYVRLYLQHARPWLLQKQEDAPDELWLSRQGTPMALESVEHVTERHRKAARIDKPIGIHVFRRSCATHMLAHGAHPVVVAKLLGHATLSSLAHYLRTTITELKKTHAATVLGR